MMLKINQAVFESHLCFPNIFFGSAQDQNQKNYASLSLPAEKSNQACDELSLYCPYGSLLLRTEKTRACFSAPMSSNTSNLTTASEEMTLYVLVYQIQPSRTQTVLHTYWCVESGIRCHIPSRSLQNTINLGKHFQNPQFLPTLKYVQL